MLEWWWGRLRHPPPSHNRPDFRLGWSCSKKFLRAPPVKMSEHGRLYIRLTQHSNFGMNRCFRECAAPEKGEKKVDVRDAACTRIRQHQAQDRSGATPRPGSSQRPQPLRPCPLWWATDRWRGGSGGGRPEGGEGEGEGVVGGMSVGCNARRRLRDTSVQ